jgi:MFS family permease
MDIDQRSSKSARSDKAAWYSELTPAHWKILIATFLGWVFDGYETYALVTVIGPAVVTLVAPSERGHIPAVAGLAIGITLLGWAVGGTVGGILADYVGRKKMLLVSVLGYAVFTGLTALSTSVDMLIALRFLTGLFLGSEWGTGNSLLAETWPNSARPKGAGFLQSGFGFGAFLAALAWYLLRPLGPESWRYMFVIGILPALLLLYLRRQIDESGKWVEAIEEKRWAVTEKVGRNSGGSRPFTLFQLFKDPVGRKRTILACLMSIGTTMGWWGIATWIPGFVGNFAHRHDMSGPYWASVTGMIYTAGAIVGYLASGFLADWFGRRRYLGFLFLGGIIMTPAVYFWSSSLPTLLIASALNGFWTLGAFAWYAIYLPELFATNVRGTASSFVFNTSRFIAFLGPLMAGELIGTLGGIANVALCFSAIYVLGLVVAPFMPETVGAPLPD